MAAAICFAAAPSATWATTAPHPLDVTLLNAEARSLQLRIRMPATQAPIMSWGGTDQAAPYLLGLIWPDTTVTLDRPLPGLSRDSMDIIQTFTVNEALGQERLDFRINHPVQPQLRRVGDTWVHRVDRVSASAAPGAADQRGSAAGPVPVSSPPWLEAEGSLRVLVPSGVSAVSEPRPAQATPAVLPSGPLSLASQASRPPGSAPADNAVEVLLLDVSVNGQRLGEVVRAEQWRNGNLLLPADAWREARLAPTEARVLSDGTPAFSLDSVVGATYVINRQTLSLKINAPSMAFVGSSLGPQATAPRIPPRPDPGVMVNYDASVQRDASSVVTSGVLVEGIAFSKWGNFVSSVLVRREGGQSSTERLDTFWRYDIPERLETLVIGDTVGVSGGWSRPARYGGFRYGRDFGQNPGFVTFPQLSLNSSAVLPSTVDVLINNARQISQSVPPGPFQLNNVPLVTGAGQLNLVVRDLLGRETVVQQSYYTSPRLLAPGLTDFSVEGGRFRTGYAQDSQYGEVFGALTWRQGLTSSLTGEARVEVQADRRTAGLELAGLLGTWAVGRAALALSGGRTQGAAEQGQMLQLGIERSTPSGGGALQYERASQGFAPFGEGTDFNAPARRSRERVLATAGGMLWRSVSGGVGYVSQSQWNGDAVKSLSLSASSPLWSRASVSFTLDKRLDGDQAWRAGVRVSLSLADGTYTSARLENAKNSPTVGAVAAARSAPAGPGVGWRVEGSSEESQRARGGVQYNTSQAEFAVDAVSNAGGQVALRGGVRGTVGLLGGVAFASRPVGQGSFAVVEVEGIAGVPIKRSHQVVAETDSRGRAFVPGLLPWQNNQIEIDPVDLPLDTEISDLVQQVTPYAGSGSVVTFAVRRSRQALVVLQQSDGSPVPAGAQVTLLPGGAEFLTGRRGEVWLTNLATGRQRVRVRWPEGGCDVELPIPTDSESTSKIGPLACGKP